MKCFFSSYNASFKLRYCSLPFLNLSSLVCRPVSVMLYSFITTICFPHFFFVKLILHAPFGSFVPSNVLFFILFYGLIRFIPLCMKDVS